MNLLHTSNENCINNADLLLQQQQFDNTIRLSRHEQVCFMRLHAS